MAHEFKNINGDTINAPKATISTESFAGAVAESAANYTLGIGDHTLLMDVSYHTRDVTLPTAVGCDGRVYTIKKTDITANPVYIYPDGSETIEGESVYTMTNPDQFVTLISDGANWTVSNESIPLTNYSPYHNKSMAGGLHISGTEVGARIVHDFMDLDEKDFSVLVRFLVPKGSDTNTLANNIGLFGLSASDSTTVAATSMRGYIDTDGSLIIELYGATTSDWIKKTYTDFLFAYQDKIIDLVVPRNAEDETMTVLINGTELVDAETSDGTPPTWGGSVDGTYFWLGQMTDAAANGLSSTIYRADVFNYPITSDFYQKLFDDGIIKEQQWASSIDRIIDDSTLNGGFKTAGAGSPDIFADWVETVASTSTINDETSDLPSGETHACRMDINASVSNASIRQDVMEVGNLYEISFYAKASAAGKEIQVRDTNIVLASVLCTTDWVKYTYYTTVFSTRLEFRRGSNTASSSLYIAKVRVKVIGCLLSSDLEYADPTVTTDVFDRSSNHYDGVASTGVTQIVNIPQLSVDKGLFNTLDVTDKITGRTLLDASGNVAADWENRKLKATGDSEVLDWENKALVGEWTVPLDASGFDGNLDTGDDTLQKVAQAVDDLTISAAAHDLLDGSIAQDTVANTVVRGDLVVGNSTPAWDVLPIGDSGEYLRSNGADPIYGPILAEHIPSGIDATKVGGGDVSDTEYNYLNGVTSAIQTQLDARVDTTGDETIAGIKTFSSIPILPATTPTNDNHAVTKNYVDTLTTTGARFICAVNASTTGVLPTTPVYDNGTLGVGATLTAGSNAAFPSIDGVAAALNNLYLIKNQASGQHNGIYKLTTVGSGSVKWVLTRFDEYDESAEIVGGTFGNTLGGTLYGNTQWSLTTTGTVVVGTTALTYNQLSSPAVYTASNGIQKVGNDFQFDFADTNPALEQGTGGVQVKVDGSSVTRTSSGLVVGAGGVTNAMLAGSIADTKLNAITTANKVNGATLYGLGSIPSGAGVIPPANHGTGTPTTSTYLRGDGAWAAVSGGGSGGGSTDGVIKQNKRKSQWSVVAAGARYDVGCSLTLTGDTPPALTYSADATNFVRYGIMTTGTTSGNSALSYLSYNYFGAKPYWSAYVQIPTITSDRVFLGMSNSVTAANFKMAIPNVQFVGFRFSTASSDVNWQCINALNSSTYNITNSAIAVTAGAWYKMEIYYDGVTITYTINDTVVATATTKLPTGSQNCYPFIYTETLTTTARPLNFSSIYAEYQGAPMSGGGAAGTVKVTSDDTTLAYLDDKIVAGNGIGKSTGSGGNETITLSTVGQMSLTVDGSGMKLVSDSASPGNSKHYGTNSGGTKGWYDDYSYTLPTAEAAVLGGVKIGTKMNIAAGVINPIVTRYISMKVIGATTDVAEATTVGGDFRMPAISGTIVDCGAYVDTAGSTGNMVIDVNLGGTTIMSSSKIVIATDQKSSEDGGAAQPVLTTTSYTANQIITVDIDSIQTTTAKGLTVWLKIQES